MYTNISCSKSTSEAVNCVSDLLTLLNHFVKYNTELSSRVMRLETCPQMVNAYSITGASILSATTTYCLAFETVLFNTRFYKRALRDRAVSITGSGSVSVNSSVLSGLSLPEVSNISIFHLAVSISKFSTLSAILPLPVRGPRPPNFEWAVS